jgi:two-component system CheB/CheR fusion protein
MDEAKQRRWHRERTARKRAEELLEAKSRELYATNEKLRRLNETLEQRVDARTKELREVNDRLIRESQERAAVTNQLRITKFATDHSGDAIFWVNPSGDLDYFNQTACRWLGYDVDELARMTVFDFDLVMTRENWREHWDNLRGRKSFVIESVHRAKDGREFPVEVTVNHVEFEGQEYNCAVVRDITERQRVVAELSNREAEAKKLSLVAARTTNAVVLTDPQGRIEWINEGFVRLTGFELEEVQGKTPGSFLQGPETDPAVVEFMSRKVREGESFKAEIVNYSKSGRRYWISIEAQPIFDDDGKLVQFMAIESDITAQKTTQKELEVSARKLSAALDTARAASEAKSTFLASMSHEIRTPMIAVVGYADLLTSSTGDTETRKDWALQLRRNSDYLLSLVNDVLDLSKIEADEIELNTQSYKLAWLVEEVSSLMRPRAIEKLLDFEVECSTPVPRCVQLDPLRFRQILVNLLSNAVKFTERGGIRVQLSGRTDPESGRAMLEARVTDTGRGIDRNRLDTLFDPFTQLHSHDEPGVRGTGLGLTISRRFARLMGGNIHVESTEGQGSTFTVIVDAGPAEGVEWIDCLDLDSPQRDESPESEMRLTGMHVHLVDDNPENVRILGFLLSGLGAGVTTSSDGKAAVRDVLAAVRANRPPDAVLMDMLMPVMDGYEATRELRKQGVKLPVIALTAFAMTGDREKCLAAGCDDYLTKPILSEALFEALSVYYRPEEKRTPVESSEPIRSERADDSKFAPLLRDYLKGLPTALREIERARENQDLDGLRNTAHRVRGTAASYGFLEVTDKAAECEDAIRSGRSWSEVALISLELQQLLARCVAS